MPQYNVPKPHSRGFQVDTLEAEAKAVAGPLSVNHINDMFLYALFARLTSIDGDVTEFRTVLDRKAQEIELDVPEEFLNLLDKITQGPNFVRFIDWLTQNVTDVSLWTKEEDSNGEYIFTNLAARVFNKLSFDSAYYHELIDNGDSGSAAEIDWCESNKHRITLTDDVTFTFNDPLGPTSLQIIIEQTSNHDITWPPTVLWSRGNAPNISNGNGSIDIVSLLYDGTSYYGTVAKDFS